MKTLTRKVEYLGILPLLASFSFLPDSNAQFYRDYIESSNQTYTDASGIYFNAGWKSTNDTVNSSALYLQNSTDEKSVNYEIESLTLSQPTSLRVNYGANATISNSELTLNDRIYVQSSSSYDPSVLLLKNCTTTFASSSMSQIKNGSSLIVEGGSFTVSQAGEEMQNISVNQGSSLIFRNANVDFTGITLQTNTDSSFKDKSATITIDNSTFKTGFVDMYGYTSSGALPVINVTNGSNFTGSFFNQEEGYYFDGKDFVYGTITTYARGGTINVSGANTVFNVSDGFKQQEDSADGQVYTTVLNISDGGKANVSGDLDISTVSVDSASLSADSIVVGAGRSMSVVGASSIEADLLSVHEGSTVALDGAATLDIAALEVILSSTELQTGTEFNLSDIFGDDASIVLAAVNNNVSMSDAEGNKFAAIVSGDGTITAGAAVPEPAACAAVFGLFALAFSASRRRK